MSIYAAHRQGPCESEDGGLRGCKMSQDTKVSLCDTAEGQSWGEPVYRGVREYEVDCSVSWRE